MVSVAAVVAGQGREGREDMDEVGASLISHRNRSSVEMCMKLSGTCNLQVALLLQLVTVLHSYSVLEMQCCSGSGIVRLTTDYSERN